MTASSFQRRLVLAGLCAGALGVTVAFWWLCTRSEAIAFLPAARDAQWIVPPTPASAEIHQAMELTARYRHRFDLADQPAKASLAVRAFRRATVSVNGTDVGELRLEGRNWKAPQEVNVAGLLRSGSNEITVSVANPLGPPALWLRLVTAQQTTGTDASWETSGAEDTWSHAQLAVHPPSIAPGSYLDGQTPLGTLVCQSWVTVLSFALLAAFGLTIWHWRLRHLGREAGRGANGAHLSSSTANAGSPDPTVPQRAGAGGWWDWLTTGARPALLLVCLVWGALFANNLPEFPRLLGFDAEGHEEYIRHLQQRGTLPLADEGWQMYQPPLYYLVAALALELPGLSTADEASVILLRAFNGVVGLAHCTLVFLSLGLLFPGQRWKQVVGTLFAGFLPAHLYVSHFVTNETLSALFVSAAVYFCLRALTADAGPGRVRNSRAEIRNALSAGVALGLALLTKFSAVLALPVLAGALAWRLMEQRCLAARRWWGSVGLFLGSTLAVCGWHYARVWGHFGRPLVGNWDAASGFTWWQMPGYHTAEYYTTFGEIFHRPLFSGFSSFADGFYSTLWGDGLAGSAAWMAFRPPWNYDLMGWGWVLAGVATLLIGVGFAVGVVRVVRKPDAVGMMFLAMLSLFALGMVYMSLRVPSYAQVKAFYGLPALLPLAAVWIAGWEWVAGRVRWLNPLLQIWFATWGLTVCATYWIRSANPETHVVKAIWAMDRGSIEEAARHYERAVALEPRHWAVASGLTDAVRRAPNVPAFRGLLGGVLRQQDRTAEAVPHYREALRLQPTSPARLNNLAGILATNPSANVRDGAEAVRVAEQACVLTGRTEATLVGTLAAAYAEAGRFDDAVATATQARDLARQTGEEAIASRNEALLEVYRAGRAWREVR